MPYCGQYPFTLEYERSIFVEVSKKTVENSEKFDMFSLELKIEKYKQKNMIINTWNRLFGIDFRNNNTIYERP